MKFTKDHEWVVEEGDIITVGITDYAQHSLGDVVFIELPIIGKTYMTGDAMAVVESVKAASDIYCPVSGTVIEVNSDLEANPQLVNEDAEAEGWFARLKVINMSELDSLLSKEEYQKFC